MNALNINFIQVLDLAEKTEHGDLYFFHIYEILGVLVKPLSFGYFNCVNLKLSNQKILMRHLPNLTWKAKKVKRNCSCSLINDVVYTWLICGSKNRP